MTSRPRVRIGLLHDTADLDDPAPGEGFGGFDAALAIERALAEAGDAAAQVDLVHAYALGLPFGTAEAVERAWRELADGGAAMIVGPSLADNAIIATALADECKVPTLNWADTARARGRWMFQLPTGSHEEEPGQMVRYLGERGVSRIAVVHEPTPSGTRMARYLREAADIAAAQVDATAMTGASPGEVAADLERVLASGPQALVHLGSGALAPLLVGALAKSAWAGPAMMNATAWRACGGQGSARWHRHAMAPTDSGAHAALGLDLGRMVAVALTTALESSRLGLRHALEHMEPLAAAMGAPGASLRFTARDHGALHGTFPLLIAPGESDLPTLNAA